MKRRTPMRSHCALVVAALTGCCMPAAAQEAGGTPSISLELNALQPTQGGCRLTFVVKNGLESDLSKAAYEVALFDKKGLVDRLTVLDFQALPKNKTKVRQFDLADAECSALGRVLINNATACEGDGIAPAACIDALQPTNKTDLEFGI